MKSSVPIYMKRLCFLRAVLTKTTLRLRVARHSLVLTVSGVVIARCIMGATPDSVVVWGDHPPPPAGLSNVVAVAAGREHSLALRLDGTVVAWGQNFYGQTNVPGNLSNIVAIAAGEFHSMALDTRGRLSLWGEPTATTIPPLAATNLIAIAANGSHSLALNTSGQVIAWGADDYGQSQVPAGLTDIVAVACGKLHSVALRRDGTIAAWGNNMFGQTNVPPHATNVIAISGGRYHTLAWRRDGTILAWGGAAIQGNVPPTASNLVSFSAGGIHNVALRSDGTVVAWGSNSAGQVAVPAGLRDVTAISAGASHSLAVAGEGLPLFPERTLSWTVGSGTPVNLDARAIGGPLSYYRWRFNGSLLGETNHVLRLGPANTNMPGLYSVETISPKGSATGALELTVTGPRIVVQPVSRTNFVGSTAVLSVVANGLAPLQYQWFFNGQVLPGATNAVLTLESIRVDQAGDYFARIQDGVGTIVSSHVIVVVNNIAAWGFNSSGQIDIPPGLTNAVSLAVGADDTVALTDQGTVRVWGSNAYGQTNVPPTLTNAAAIAAGHYHTLALTADGTVIAWGRNDSGQADVPADLTNVIAIAAGQTHSVALRSDGMVIAWGRNDFGQTNVPAHLTNVVAITAGRDHSAALKADGRVAAWGKSDSGELAVPPDLDRVVAVAAGGLHTLALRDDGTVVCWGLNNVGQANVPATATNVVAVAGGFSHSLALRQDGVVVAWGYNGNGETNVPATLSNVVAIAAGKYHNAAIIGDGRLVLPPRSTRRDVHSGTTVILNAMFIGAPPLSFQWQFNGTNITGATNAWLSLTNLQPTQSGTYRVLVSNALGFAVSETTLRVENAAPVLLLEPLPLETYPGASVKLDAVADGSEPIEYQWLHDGAPLPGATNHTLILDPVRLSHRGNYSVVVRNSFGTITSSNAELFIPQVVAYGYYSSLEPNCFPWPVFVPKDLTNEVVAVSAGTQYSMSLSKDGRVRAWGTLDNWCEDAWGQTNVPVDLTNVVAIAAGANHCLALRSDGTLAAWGNPYFGLNSTATNLTNVVAIDAGQNYSVALTADGRVVLWGAVPGTNVIASISNAVAVSAGTRHGLALRADGTVVAWGSNWGGETNVPPGLSNVIAIAATKRNYLGFSLALKSDLTVVTWGDISPPPAGTNIVAISAGSSALTLRPDGTLSMWSCHFSSCPPPELTNVFAIAAGRAHTLALLREELPPPPDAAPTIAQPRLTDSEFRLSLPTIRGQVYALEYKNSLLEPTWTSVPPLVLGDGGLKDLTHRDAGASQRFYRVRRWR